MSTMGLILGNLTGTFKLGSVDAPGIGSGLGRLGAGSTEMGHMYVHEMNGSGIVFARHCICGPDANWPG